MQDRRYAYRFWWGNLWEGDHLEDPDVDGRIIRILKWIFEKCDWEARTGWIWLMTAAGGRLL
jgi:hypothetical protein